MGGFDLFETPARELPLSRVVSLKARPGAETGLLFKSVQENFLR